MNWLPGSLSVLFVLLVAAVEMYRRYGGRSEELLAQIRDKTSAGIVGRKLYFLVIQVKGEYLRCETTAANWTKAQPGDFATVTLMRGSFVSSLTMMRNLRPEELLRLQQEINQKESFGR